MAQAIEEMYPGAKLTIGPAIENGFYYDVDFGEHKISENDFKKIEDRMLQIAREKHEFKLREVSRPMPSPIIRSATMNLRLS